MRGRSPAVVIAALLLASGATSALADGKRVRDRNDTRGVLDIATVSHGHRRTSTGERRLVHTIRLREAWPVKKLGHEAFALIYFELKGNPDSPPERTVQIEYEKGRLVARMFDLLVDPSRHLGRVALWRPDWRTLRVSFPKSLLREGLQRYKWNAVTFVEKGRGVCPRTGGCVDWAPDTKRRLQYVRHVL